MTTPTVLDEALQVLRDACYGHGLAAASVKVDAALVTYAPGDGAVVVTDRAPDLRIPEAHILTVTREPGS